MKLHNRKEVFYTFKNGEKQGDNNSVDYFSRQLKNEDYLRRLKIERFGNQSGSGKHSIIFNLAGVKLSKMETEVLELGLDFGLPQKSSREEILAEFELLHQTLIKYRPISKEEADACRARLVDIAETTYRTPPQHNRFSLEKQYLQTIRQLKNNKDLVITRPDKGKGVVVMKKSDCIAKMNDLLNDKSKPYALALYRKWITQLVRKRLCRTYSGHYTRRKNLMMPPMRK